MNTLPTIFHVTHWKAGSQWVAEILKQSSPERFIQSKAHPSSIPRIFTRNPTPGTTRYLIFIDHNNQQIRTEPIVSGGIYGAVYADREYFEHFVPGKFFSKLYIEELIYQPRRVILNWWQFGVRQYPYKFFFVIRDLRDALTSLYFSEKISHELLHQAMRDSREMLNNLNEENGLIHLINNRPGIARIQASWAKNNSVEWFTYESLIEKPFFEYERMMDFCKINISGERLRNIVANNQFESATGRKRGDEDLNSHFRKGIVGDWKNHFTERVKMEFKKRYGQLLIDTGYEEDMDW